MYRIEIEKADGNCFFYGQPDEEDGRWFDTVEDADVTAEKLWRMRGATGEYARFSVVENSDGTITDWEC